MLLGGGCCCAGEGSPQTSRKSRVRKRGMIEKECLWSVRGRGMMIDPELFMFFRGVCSKEWWNWWDMQHLQNQKRSWKKLSQVRPWVYLRSRKPVCWLTGTARRVKSIVLYYAWSSARLVDTFNSCRLPAEIGEWLKRADVWCRHQ